jgi:hypothetical protein
MAAPMPGRRTAAPISPPAVAPPSAPIPAPFSRVVKEPPAHPASNVATKPMLTTTLKMRFEAPVFRFMAFGLLAPLDAVAPHLFTGATGKAVSAKSGTGRGFTKKCVQRNF